MAGVVLYCEPVLAVLEDFCCLQIVLSNRTIL